MVKSSGVEKGELFVGVQIRQLVLPFPLEEDQTHISCTAGYFLLSEPPRKPLNMKPNQISKNKNQVFESEAPLSAQGKLRAWGPAGALGIQLPSLLLSSW